MLHDILFLIIGIALVLGGANYLTDGATAIARKFRVPELVIGMTVVAFGSCTPDLVVSLTSTLQDKGAMAVANIVGANIFDIFLVIGICAALRPVTIGKDTLRMVFPMVALSSTVLFLMACDMLIDGMPSNFIDRSDGLILLCFFAINCAVTYVVSRSPDALSPSGTGTDGSKQAAPKPLKMWLAAVMVAGGLGALVIGGDWFVNSASGIAEKAGMSESLVGLTIVAIGSSLPDLSTSLIAAIKGHSGIAVGNIVGSCVINVFFVIGLCSTVKTLDLGTVNAIDFGVLVAGSLLIWLFGRFWGRRTINRPEGLILILGYVGYFIYLILSDK